MKRSMMTVLAVLAFLFLPACASQQQTRSGALGDSEDVPIRTFFSQIHFYGPYEVEVGMADFEDVLNDVFPAHLREEDGRVPEGYLAGMYRDAAAGDLYITLEEFQQYDPRFVHSVLRTLPDPLRAIQQEARRE